MNREDIFERQVLRSLNVIFHRYLYQNRVLTVAVRRTGPETFRVYDRDELNVKLAHVNDGILRYSRVEGEEYRIKQGILENICNDLEQAKRSYVTYVRANRNELHPV